jgi:two-component system OmpR family response regulator
VTKVKEFYPSRASGSNDLFYERQSKAKHQLLSAISLGGLDHLTLFFRLEPIISNAASGIFDGPRGPGFGYQSNSIAQGDCMRILLVEDDQKIASFILKGLKAEGFAVDHADNGEDGLHFALTEPYDAAVIDIMLPKLDGLTLIEQMRREKNKTPVIILSAKGSVDDRVKGLQTGGDDYMTKPFAFSELLARVQALIRRSSNIAEPTRLVVGDVSMNLITREVIRGETKIDLQPLEFSLLEYLMRNAGRVVSKTMIMEHVWDYYFDPQTNVVESRIYKLREKIDKGFDRKLIHTVRGVGYVLKQEDN